jgi:hypothetical protein
VGVLESKMPTSSYDRHLAFQNPHSHFPFSQYPYGIMENEAHEQYISGTPKSKGFIHKFHPQSFFGDGIIVQQINQTMSFTCAHN